MPSSKSKTPKPMIAQVDARLVVVDEENMSDAAKLIAQYSAAGNELSEMLRAHAVENYADDSDTVVDIGPNKDPIKSAELHRELTALIKESQAIGHKIQALLVGSGATAADDDATVIIKPD